ncbi:MAG: DUF2782 domain-containing protein, partial [Arenimonas sp.]
MKIILIALLVLAAQGATAAEKAAEPVAKETAAPTAKEEAPIPEKIPAKENDKNAPSVRIRTSDNGDIVEEYRQGGVVSMVKVTPKH